MELVLQERPFMFMIRCLYKQSADISWDQHTVKAGGW
jgi:hypothetical protein